jgi:hypothetical protein
MTRLTENFTGGAHNDVVTTANTSFTTVDTEIGGKINRFHLDSSLMWNRLMSGTSTSSIWNRWAITSLGSTLRYRFYARMPVLPGVAMPLARWDAGTVTHRTQLRITAAGKVDVARADFTTSGSVSALSFPTNRTVRIEGRVVLSATVGFHEAQLFNFSGADDPHKTTPDETIGGVVNQNLGGTADVVRFGLINNSTNFEVFLRGIVVDDVDVAIGPIQAAPGTVVLTSQVASNDPFPQFAAGWSVSGGQPTHYRLERRVISSPIGVQ